MLSVEQAAKSARGMIGKTIKSSRSVATKFQPPAYPALIVTSAFTSPHINQLKKALEQNFIAYGMQTSKKKVNRPPGFPTDKNFVIVDDLLGPSILQGEFLGLKMCRVDYPRANSVKEVIKKFDKYIGLGKQTVQQKQKIQQIEGSQWQKNQDYVKKVGATKGRGKNQIEEMNNDILGNGFQLGDIQKGFEVKQQVQNFRDVFKRNKKKSSSSSSISSSSKGHKDMSKKKKEKSSKQKSKVKRLEQKNKIRLKSVNKIGGKFRNNELEKRSLFMLLTNKQSDKYEKQVKKLGSGQNKRMIPINSLSQYYKLSYEDGQGENCLLLSPDIAFKELHKFRNLKDVYIYGDDPQFCTQLVKGNIKNAALDPQSLQKILNDEGFNKDEPKEYIKPKRWVGSKNKKLNNRIQAKSDEDDNKNSLFSRFVNFFKGKKKQKKKGLSVSSDGKKYSKSQKRNKSGSNSMSSSSSISKSSSSNKNNMNQEKLKQYGKQKGMDEKKLNKQVSKSYKILQPVSLGRLVCQNLKLQHPIIQQQNEKNRQIPSKRIIKIKSKTSGREMKNQTIITDKPNLDHELNNPKSNLKVLGKLQIQSVNKSDKGDKQRDVFAQKQPSAIIKNSFKIKQNQLMKGLQTKKLQFEPSQKNKQTSSSNSSSVSNNEISPSQMYGWQKKKKQDNQVLSFSKPKDQIGDYLISNKSDKQSDEDQYQTKEKARKKIIIQKQNRIYRKINSPEPVFHFQPNDDQTDLKVKRASILKCNQFQKPSQLQKIERSLHNHISAQQHLDKDFNQNLQVTAPFINKDNENNKKLLNNTNTPANQAIHSNQRQKLIQEGRPLITSHIIPNLTQVPFNLTENYRKPLQNRNIRFQSTAPISANLPFDQAKYYKTVENGITVYRPKGFSLYNSIPVSPSPFTNTSTLYFNPNVPPLQQKKSSSHCNSPFFVGFPLKSTVSTQKTSTNNNLIPKPQAPLFSTFEYFKNNNSLPVHSEQEFDSKNNKQINKKMPIEREFEDGCQKCKRISGQKSKKRKDKQNQNCFENEYCTRLSNKLTKTRQFYDSLDSDESCSKQKYKSKDKYKNRDPLSSILDQNCNLDGSKNNKNYSVLYVVHSKLSPQHIKELFEISDSSDTIQTFSRPQKMQQIIQKAQNVFDFILIFFPDLEHQHNNFVLQNKNLYYVQYSNSKDIQNPIQKNVIKIKKAEDLYGLLQTMYQNKPTKKHKIDETEKIGHIYFKDFNKNIRSLAKIMKRYYPNAQTRKYFSVKDLPTRLPSIKNELTLILIDQISFKQITKYCQEQQMNDSNLIKICIPKSGQAMKLCKNQPGLEKMIWLTERELQDPEFIIRRLIKRNK